MVDYFKDKGPEEVIEELIDHKVISILKVILSEKEKQFYLKEISEEAIVPIATTYRILQKLKDLSIINEIKIGKFKVYNAATNDKVVFLDSLIKGEKKALKQFVNKVKELTGVKSIILQGKNIDTKANIIIIGDNVNTDTLKEISYNIKEKYDFTVSYLILPQYQYDQMLEMGLYSGQKKVLFQR